MTTIPAPPVPSRAAARAWVPWAATAARLLLGGVLIATGAVKVGDLEESVWAVRAYDLLPVGLAEVVGRALPLVEIGVGMLLVAGLLTRWAAVVAGLLMLGFTIGIASAWARGLAIDCGCFGGGGPIDPDEVSYLPDLLRDGALFALAALLAWRPTSRLSLDGALAAGVPAGEPERSTDVQ